jgi:hypothetical protein
MHSLESRLQRFINILRCKKNRFSKKEYGVEQWWDSPSGNIIVRHIDIAWLKDFYRKQNLHLLYRFPGQFTESYTVITNKFLLKFIYRLNLLMFKYIKLPSLSFGKLVFKKFK